MEGNLLHPFVEMLGVFCGEKELRLVFCDNAEHVLSLRVITCPFALGLVQDQRRRCCFALDEILVVLEEA